MLPLLGAIGAGASILGGLGSFFANKSANDRAQMLQDRGLQEWMAANIPDPEQQKLALEEFVTQGTLNPALEQAIAAKPSEFKNIVTSSTNRSAQNRALSELEEIGNQGGLRLQDKAALQESMQGSQVRDRANRQGITAEMARRGTGGSGIEVASQLQGQQATSDRDANNSLKVAAMAQDRALQSIMGAGDLASKYRTQDFGEQEKKAAAADKINLFNTQNLQDVQHRNLGMQNRAQEMNLAQRQKTSDQNTQLSNQQQQYNKELMQQQFNNKAKKAAGMGGQYNQMAQTEQQGGAQTGQLLSTLGGGISNVANAQANQDFWNDYFHPKKTPGVTTTDVTADLWDDYRKKNQLA